MAAPPGSSTRRCESRAPRLVPHIRYKFVRPGRYTAAMALNPFIWDRPIDDPSKIIGMEAFAHQVALTLKGQTNVALFGPRDTGKTTFVNQLALELVKAHGVDAPPFDVVKINLQRVVSIPGFIGCVHDAMVGHPVKQSAARRPASDRGAREGDRLRHQGDQGIGAARGRQARAGRGDLARATGRAALALAAPRGRVRRVPAAPALPRRSARDHPLGADELGREPRLVAVHRVDPQRAEDDARGLRPADLRRGRPACSCRASASRLPRVPRLPVRGDRQAGRGAGARLPPERDPLAPAQHPAARVGDLGQHAGRPAGHARGGDRRT